MNNLLVNPDSNVVILTSLIVITYKCKRALLPISILLVSSEMKNAKAAKEKVFVFKLVNNLINYYALCMYANTDYCTFRKINTFSFTINSCYWNCRLMLRLLQHKLLSLDQTLLLLILVLLLLLKVEVNDQWKILLLVLLFCQLLTRG
jgi:hypothetical protein